jgi:hypothetical protein
MSTVTGPTPSIDRVLGALDRLGYSPRPNGSGHLALCPVHDDHNRSLGVDYKDGKTMVRCRSQGCDFKEIVAALGLAETDLFDDEPVKQTGDQAKPRLRPVRAPRPAPKPRTPAPPECLGEYDKHDYARWAQGPITSAAQTWHAYYDPTTAEVVAWHFRNRCRRPGCTEKVVPWAVPKGRGVAYRLPKGIRLPLYGQLALADAIKAGTTVYVTEGESDADAVTEAGAVAVTMGSADDGHGSWWRPWHTEALASAASVIVCADRDKAGYASAAYIAGQLADAGVPLVRVVEAATGKDVRDHLAAGHTLADLVDITATITPTDPPKDDALTTPAGAEPTTDPTDDDAPQPGPMPDDLAAPSAPADRDHISVGGAIYRQLGEPKFQLVEVTHRTDPNTKQVIESKHPLLRGTIDVTDNYSQRGITADCTPSGEVSGTINEVSFTPPGGQPRTTRISDIELRGTKDIEWPKRLGIDNYWETASSKKIPDVIRAMAYSRVEREAYDATGLLRRSRKPPVFLRPDQPALTGDPAIFDPSAITKLPAALEEIPGLRHLSLADPSTAEQAADDWQSWWDVRLIADDGDPGVLLALIALTAAAPWSSLPGLGMPCLYLDAETGAGKTTLTGLVTGWQSGTFTPTAAEAAAVAMSAESMSSIGARAVMNMFRGFVITQDDYFTKGQTPQVTAKQTAMLNDTVRGAKSGAGDIKANRDGSLRPGRAIRSVPLATGEAFTDPKSSQSARFVRGRLAAGTLGLAAHRAAGTRNEALNLAQATVRAAARAHSAGICDGLADLDQVRAASRWATGEVITWCIPGNPHLSGGYAALMHGARMFAERAGRLGIEDPDRISAVFAEFLRPMAMAQGTGSVVRNAIADLHGADVETIITTLRTLILAGTWRFDDAEINNPPTVPGRPPEAFGWTKVTGGRSDLGPPEHRPTGGHGSYIGTVHTHTPGTAVRPPTWPATARTEGAVLLRVTPDDWTRIYTEVAERAGSQMYLPTADEARPILAAAGYLRTAEARPAPMGGGRVLTLDLGRVLAGEDGAADVASNEAADENDSHHDDDQNRPVGDLATLTTVLSDVVSDVENFASSQVNRLSDVSDVSDVDAPIEKSSDGVVCSVCKKKFTAGEQWRADAGCTTCLECLDRGSERAQDQGLPTVCPGCSRPVGSERLRATYAGWHMACAPAEIRTAGDFTLDHPKGATEATEATEAHDGPRVERPTDGTTGAKTGPQRAPGGPADELSAFGAWLRKPDGGDYPDATDAEIAEALRLWALALPMKIGGGHVEWSYPAGVATALLNGWVKRGDTVRQAQGGEALAPLSEDTTAYLRNLDRWKISNHGARGLHQEGDTVAAWDVNAMYLNAADVSVGIGEPEPEGDVPDDWQKHAGWVRLADPVPHLPYGHDRTTAGQWLPVPLAIYFCQRAEKAGDALTFDRAWLWSRRNTAAPLKVLRRDLIFARKTLGRADGRPGEMAERALKAVYTRALGGLLASSAHNKGATYRPDWAEQIRGKAVAGMLRGLDKVPGADRAVVAFEVDAVLINLSRVQTDEAGTPVGLVVVETIPDDDKAPWAGKWKPVNHGAKVQLSADDVQRAQGGFGNRNLFKTLKTIEGNV